MTSYATASARPNCRPGPIAPVERLNEEEKALARSLAGEFDRLTALVAGAGRPAVPECSMAARVLTELLRLNRRSRERIGAASCNGRDAEARRSACPPDPFEVNPVLRAQLRRLARRRLDAVRPRISAAIDAALREKSGAQLQRVAATTVDLQLAGEIDTSWRREINISSPEVLDFRWRTEESGAARGYWELRGPAFLGNPGQVLASGYLPDVPGEAGIGGYFTIALGPYLPPTAPPAATTYRVRVLPLPPYSRYNLVPAPFSLQPLTEVQSVEPIAPEGVGPWSPPAIIRYGKSFETPPQHFDIEPLTVYRKLRFVMDWFRVVEDQSGPGSEEIHIAGFVMQHTSQGVALSKFGPSGHTVAEDDRSNHTTGTQVTFNLPPSTNMAYWPRTYTAVVSIMEKDDGGQMNDWLASLATLAAEMASGVVAADITAFLEEVREEIKAKQAELLAEATAEMAALFVTIITATAREAITAFIAAILAGILAAIRAGAVDDFYGTQAFGLVLWTNDADRVADGSAGEVFTSRIVASGGEMAGSAQPDGTFRMNLTELQFLGMGGALEGSPTSGIVNVGMHWEFRDKLDL